MRCANGFCSPLLATLLLAAPLFGQRELYTIHESAPGDQFGQAVSFVGDIDKDGCDDFVAGAIQQITTPTAAGYARVYSGRHGVRLYEFKGDALLDFFGASVSGAGDVDRDGYPDIVVGSQSTFGTQVKGYAKLFSGKDGKQLAKLEGDAIGDDFGYSVSGAGDVDRDGYADVIIGARRGGVSSGIGYARVYSGKDRSVLHTFRGKSGGDEFGFSVSGAGDVDRDGYADLIVGARSALKNTTATGSAVVYSGFDGKVLHTFYGDSAMDFFGESVSGAGDVNRDGYADVIVGAFWDSDNGNRCGSARVFSGADGKVLYTFYGDGASNYLGRAVGGAGDVDRDGYDDVVAGAFGHGKNGSRCGCVRIYSGSDGKILFDFYGDSAGITLGYSVSGGGDLNADGYPDILAGLPADTLGGANSGSARAFSGNPTLTYDVFGKGCASTSPVLPRIRAMDAPLIGKDFELEVRDLRPARLGLLLFGISNRSWNGTPLPLDLGFFDMPGCQLLVSWDLQYPIWSGAGILPFRLTLPDNPAAVGVTFYNQCWLLDESANSRGIATSNAGQGTLRK